MCKLIKWNPSLLLAILPSIRYFKIERENFRVPHRGLAGKKLFTNYNAVSSPRRVIWDFLFVFFFPLFHYCNACQQRGKEIFGQALHYERTNFLTLFLKRCSWEAKVGSKFRVQLPFKVPFELVSIAFFPSFSGSSILPKEHYFQLFYGKWRFFVSSEEPPILIKKVFKILPLRQIATQRCNFETHAMMDSRSYGQHSH